MVTVVVVIVVVVIVVRVKRSVINAVICFKEFKEKHLHALPERVLSRSPRQFMLGAHSLGTVNPNEHSSTCSSIHFPARHRLDKVFLKQIKRIGLQKYTLLFILFLELCKDKKNTLI